MRNKLTIFYAVLGLSPAQYSRLISLDRFITRSLERLDHTVIWTLTTHCRTHT